jgi:hypothetical protein
MSRAVPSPQFQTMYHHFAAHSKMRKWLILVAERVLTTDRIFITGTSVALPETL